MPLTGFCSVCRRISNSLMICVYCGSKACIDCIDPRVGKCKRCKESSAKTVNSLND